MSFIEEMKLKAKSNIKRIILPESEDLRILKATEQIMNEGFAKVILIGDSESINKKSAENINNRASYNFTLGIYDSVNKVLYFYELDT